MRSRGCSLRWASLNGRPCSRLWRCARPGPSTPDAAPKRAARGAGSYGYFCRPASGLQASSRAQRALLVRRLGLVVGSSHARGRTRRASPVWIRHDKSGGCHGACAFWGHDSNQQQALNSVTKQPARGGACGARSEHARIAHAHRATALVSHSRQAARRGLSPASAVARSLHCRLLRTLSAPRARGRWRLSRRACAPPTRAGMRRSCAPDIGCFGSKRRSS